MPIENTAEMLKRSRLGTMLGMMPVEERWEEWKARYAMLRTTIYQMVIRELGRSVA
jgi:hypothetical protein